MKYLTAILIILMPICAISMELVATSPFTYWGFKIYQISLYTENGHYEPDGEMQLKIEYERYLSGKDIAKHSIDEMKKIGLKDEKLAKTWHDDMVKIFPNVNKDIILIGLKKTNGQTIFYKNAVNDNNILGYVDNPEFGRYFFGIWLNEKSSNPILYKILQSKGIL